MVNIYLNRTALKCKTNIDSQMCFNISYSVYLFSFILNLSFYRKFLPLKLISVICVLILFIGELLKGKYTLKEASFLALCMLLSLLAYLRGGYAMFLHFMFIFCNRHIPLKQTAKLTVAVSCIALIIIITSAYVGVIPNHVVHFLQNNSPRERVYLGFLYALYPSMLLYNIVSMDLYIHRKQLTLFRCLWWTALSTLMYWKTDSRLSYFLTLLIVISFLFLKKWPFLVKKFDFVFKMMISSFIICPIVSFGLTLSYSYNNVFIRNLNTILEGRLRLGKNAFQEYDIKLFGQEIQYIGNGLNANGETANGIYNYVDCFYENILLRYGLIFFILVIIFFTSCLSIAYKKKNYHLIILLTVLAVHGIIDDLVLYVYYNTLWLLIGICIFSSRNIEPLQEKLKAQFSKMFMT